MRPVSIDHAMRWRTPALVALAALLAALAFGAVRAPEAAAACTAPSVSGSLEVGATLSATAGGCIPPASAVTLQWHRCTGADSTTCTTPLKAPEGSPSTYVPTAADAGRRLGVRQVATTLLGDEVTWFVTGVIDGPPSASFTASPNPAGLGQSVSFNSTSSDPDGDSLAHAWDLDGDGEFDDGTGTFASRSYNQPGTRAVSLRVTAGGKSAVATVNVVIQTVAGQPGGGGGGGGGQGGAGATKLMSPFPVVAIAGRLTSKGARVSRLSVKGPPGAAVLVRCRGRGCPAGVARAKVGSSGTVRLKRFQRSLRAGVVLEILVTKPGVVGKYTRFRIRRRRPPLRTDACVQPGATRASACPS
jgi:PKD repeat protein